MIRRLSLAFFAVALLRPALAGAKTESAWRSALSPAFDRLQAQPVFGDFPPGVLNGLTFPVDEPAGAEDRLAPVIEQLEREQNLTPSAFSSLHGSQDFTLALAIDGAVAQARRNAEQLIARSMWLGHPAVADDPATLQRDMDSALRGGGSFLIPRDVRRRLEAARSTVAEQVRSQRRRVVEEALEESSDALQVRVTRNFRSDTKGFKDGDWQRLQVELDKIGRLLETGKVHLGDQGKIRTFGTALRGISEIKFGTKNRYRVFFRYDPKTKRVTLLRYIHRMKIEPESQAHRDLEEFTKPAYLESRVDPDPMALKLRPIPVRRRVAVGEPFEIERLEIEE